ncbi:MAG TPA: hypothetical protein VNI20_03360 [Fimbriimonadaceae bacterium]|nr:hypothetical protein [Fimbriimonadaceae bacterium]
MKKSTKVTLLVATILVISLCGGLWSMLSNAQKVLTRARTEAKTEGNEILVLLAGSWDYSAVQLRLSPEFDDKYSEDEARKQFGQWKQTYGDLASGEMKIVSFEAGGKSLGEPVLVAKLACEATFDKGKADVKMTLMRRPKNDWQMSDFEVGPLK